MMKLHLKQLIVKSMLMLGAICSQAQDTTSTFNPLKHISLQEEEGVTIFKNSTNDTVTLSGMYFNNLPYRETNFIIKIAPGRSDSLKLRYTYPDLIFIYNINAVYNGPGGRVVCDIYSTKPKTVNTKFSGDLKLENTYYQAYFNYLGNTDMEGRPYYKIGDALTNFNKFPALADSVTQIRFDFLSGYNQPLPAYFKKHEYQRLMYNGIMRKDNVLASKRFYGGKPIPVKDDYYDFYRSVRFDEPTMIINTEYLWATDLYLFYLSKQVKKKVPDAMVSVIDSLCGNTTIGDIMKMRRLSKIYMTSTAKYDSVIKSISFHNPVNRSIIDSLIQTKLGLPKLGSKAPGFELEDIAGKPIALKSFTGRTVILNFWASWCGPCIAEFSAENKLYQTFKHKGLTVINICVDSEKKRWQQLSADHNLQMVNLFVNADIYRSLKVKYNIGALPRSVLIDKDQKVTDSYFKRSSSITASDMDQLLK